MKSLHKGNIINVTYFDSPVLSNSDSCLHSMLRQLDFHYRDKRHRHVPTVPVSCHHPECQTIISYITAGMGNLI